jgi:hypothetical protein
MAQKKNLVNYNILNLLCRDLYNKIGELEEQDVTTLMRAYKFMDHTVHGSSKLLLRLNQTVVNLAV